ncbi:uncharacterized protein LOC113324135 [Papaver somniferum]|uniref:uncharacterized protein LOC113324135 n=1 Tax=Papaver somniferum TaxID=3469 RepID=UPI000E6F468F|nr:uncharacterized protein LOC113324135 [Papaver somniferum]
MSSLANATGEIEHDIGIRINSMDAVTTEDRVENPFEDTRVFVEVQVRDRTHMYRSRNNIIIDLISGKCLEAKEKREPTTVKIFGINFADLFTSDVFSNCNLDPLLSLDSLENSPTELNFWNFFKHAVSRFGNKSAKLNLAEKKSVLILVVKIELLFIAYGGNVGKEIKMLKFRLRGSRSKNNKNICEKMGIVDYKDDHGEAAQVKSTSMLKTHYVKAFNKDNNGDEKEECVICLDEFKEGNNAMELYCGHVFHNQCVIKWINETEPQSVCPICRHPLNPFSFDT